MKRSRTVGQFHDDVIKGLSRSPKELPCKYFYDERGSRLFDRICELPEYYLTRTELGIMRQNALAMAEAVGPQCRLIEYGSGSSLKTPLLLEALDNPACYVPVDISGDYLVHAAAALSRRFPDLEVTPVTADFTQPFELPLTHRYVRRQVIYFPGSTIGNFAPAEAVDLMAKMAGQVGEDGGLLIGVDLRKGVDVLEHAYNDSSEVTAAFNLNLLARINSELDGDFDLNAFQHRAVFNEHFSRIEMHLFSRRAQVVHIGRHTFEFKKGESIRTEYSHKYTREAFRRLASAAGFEVRQIWTDDKDLFSVQYLTMGEWGCAAESGAA